MFRKVFTALGQLWIFVIRLILALAFGIATWICWTFYHEVRLQNLFAKEAHLISVRVDAVNYEQRSWRDMLQNTAYLTVTYRGRPYTTRFIMDTAYVSEGGRVPLLYHPDYDSFRQPGHEIHFKESTGKSRLIRWTTVDTFSDENKLLFFCLILFTAFFLFSSGVLTSLIPIPWLQTMGRLLLTIEFVAAAIFFTYDTWAYFQYYQHLKTQGHLITVDVLDTNQRALRRRRSKMRWYTYEARIRHNQQEFLIPISQDDFETVKAGDSLRVFYDDAVPDFMSVDFPPDYNRVFLPLIFVVLAFLMLRSGLKQSKPQATFPA